MANGDPDDDLSEMELLKIAREEAHRTLENQINTLDSIDQKAAKILRLNFILVGAALTGISAIATNKGLNDAVGGVESLLNIYSLAGITSILLSSSLAAFTYTTTTKRAGMSGRDIANLISNDYSSKANLEGIVESYSIWLRYNFKTNTKIAPLGTSILIFLIYGLIFISAGVYHGVFAPIGTLGIVLIVVVIAVFTYFSGIIEQLSRYRKYKDLDPTED